ncbi:hypothetical protein BDN70DRAFT_994012 [Pholiota conissans]|uniref:Uncharacterized protein n=1 Tax=Pholiota conissans TaxID=109636 RepID=A0A9P6D0K3_9AGAR|nr:hypothetical protein BDN70DRAFT_994012 [Pholiota conissans]
MARATRSSTADLKRKRSPDVVQHNDHAPNKLPRTDHPADLIDARPILHVLETEDKQGLLDRVFPAQDSLHTVSLRALLSAPSPLSALKAAINNLLPISSLPRAKPSHTAAQQIRFCNLALSLLEQVPPSLDHLQSTSILPDSPEHSPERPKLSYALVQHLPSGDFWTSLASLPSPSSLQTANAELVAILPSPSSSSSDKPIPTLGSYSTKPPSQRKPPLAPRRVSTGAFLDYGLYSSFAPSFDQDGELVGRNQLGQVLMYREEKKRLRNTMRRERLEGVGSIVDVTPEPERPSSSEQQDDDDAAVPDLELEGLLPPEEVASIKAALGDLELEKLVQRLLERNQKALERLGELQRQRLTNHPTRNADEDSEEWETAQAIMDSLTLLASLRPRSSSEESPAIVPPSSLLHKLHLTLATQASPGWYGTLPPARSGALRDDATVKVKAGAAAVAPTTPAAATPSGAAGQVGAAAGPAAISASNTFGAYGYTYGQPQNYRPQQAAAYTPYKTGQGPVYYQNYMQPAQGQFYGQQGYGATTNQQPYGATVQQPYGGAYGGWYGQYTAPATQTGAGTGSGRGTPQPATVATPMAASSYTTFFNQPTGGGTATPSGTRTPAVANTVVGGGTAGTYSGAAMGAIATLPAHLRTSTVNGTAAAYQQGYYYQR